MFFPIISTVKIIHQPPFRHHIPMIGLLMWETEKK